MNKSIDIRHFKNLSACEGAKHGITTRAGGKSAFPRSSLNLGNHVEDDIELVTQNRTLLAETFGVEEIVFPNQTHSSNVAIVTDKKVDLKNVDSIVTNEKGLCIGVLTADCVPILLYDSVKGVCGSIHAGWRGSVEDIAGKTIRLMSSKFGSKPKDIVGGIGPSISSRNYEVGGEVIEKVDKLISSKIPVITNRNKDKGNLDLWMLNKILMIQSGILQDNIEVMGICTYQDEAFYSARRDGIHTGRFASFIMNC